MIPQSFCDYNCLKPADPLKSLSIVRFLVFWIGNFCRKISESAIENLEDPQVGQSVRFSLLVRQVRFSMGSRWAIAVTGGGQEPQRNGQCCRGCNEATSAAGLLHLKYAAKTVSMSSPCCALSRAKEGGSVEVKRG